MGATSIEWTDHSINPIRARLASGQGKGHYCEKISPGCKNCYSSRLQPRLGMPPFNEQRKRDDIEHWLDARKLQEVLRRRAPTKFFWCDMTDMFGEWVPDDWIAACFGVMVATPHHTHQVLTKRADRLLRFFGMHGGDYRSNVNWWINDACLKLDEKSTFGFRLRVPDSVLSGEALPNIWIGVSAEDQQRADERIPLLLRCPAAVHWVSAEPLLGSITFPWKTLGQGSDCPEHGRMVRVDEDGCCITCGLDAMWYGLDWIVAGGESGQKARPCDVSWLRSIVRQCDESGARCFVKQVGAVPLADTCSRCGGSGEMAHQLQAPGLPRLACAACDGHGKERIYLNHLKGGNADEWPADLRVRQFPETRS